MARRGFSSLFFGKILVFLYFCSFNGVRNTPILTAFLSKSHFFKLDILLKPNFTKLIAKIAFKKSYTKAGQFTLNEITPFALGKDGK